MLLSILFYCFPLTNNRRLRVFKLNVFNVFNVNAKLLLTYFNKYVRGLLMHLAYYHPKDGDETQNVPHDLHLHIVGNYLQ